MKILKGTLTECRYDWPEQDGGQAMQITSEETLPTNAVAYMSDELGVHHMRNPGNDLAVSLHTYCPPHVARHGCEIYNTSTGKASHVMAAFYSRYGQLLPE